MAKKFKAKEQRELLNLAKKHLYEVEDRGDLETRGSDDWDFLEVSVWSLKAFMEEVYELGKEQGKKEAKTK